MLLGLNSKSIILVEPSNLLWIVLEDAQYGKALYNGVLKFGINKQECSVSKFQQMDEFAIRKLFDF